MMMMEHREALQALRGDLELKNSTENKGGGGRGDLRQRGRGRNNLFLSPSKFPLVPRIG